MIVENRQAQDCDHLNFTQCDRCILKLLRPHLMETKANQLDGSRMQLLLTQFKQAFERGGAVCLSVDGQVQFMNRQAEKLLGKYLGTASSRRLPELLNHWFKHQISQLALGQEPSNCFPLHVEQAERQLIICLIPDPRREQYLLLLEERDLPSFSIPALELLGLTKREAEVVFWIAKDKSNTSIARQLGCSKGTVCKHLEHVYKKLGVQTRTGAVMLALEKLGLLNEQFVANSS